MRPSIFVFATLIATISALSPSRAIRRENATSKYPTEYEIAKIFESVEDSDWNTFFTHVAPNFTWTMMGTHPLAGEYHNVTVFAIDTLERLGNTMDMSKPVSMKLVNIIGGGESEWSVQELHGSSVCKNGLKYDNRFAWVTRWNTAGKIVQVRSYLDSALVSRVIRENESPDYTYTDQRRTLVPGPVGGNCAA